MAVGKPDFELNSFGIQYKEKRVKYFQKDDDSLENTDQQLLDSRQDNDSKINTLKVPKIGESISIGDTTTPKAPSSNLRTHKRLTSGNTPSSNISGKKYEKLTNPKTTTPKPTSSTRSQFMSKDPADKLSHTERKLRTDMEESGTKVDTSAAGITQRVKPLHGKNQDGSDTDTSKEVAPTFAPKQNVGSYSKGKLDSKDSKGKKRQIKFLGEPYEKYESRNRKQHKRSFKRLPKHVGDAPEGVNSETELVNQRNTKVGVGVDAHKKFQKNPQGELTSSQKPKVKNPDQFSATDGRKVDLNNQNRMSQAVRNHNKRGKNNSKWYNKEQRAEYNKIDPKDRNAQSTYHTAQEKKYKKDVNTKKELSTAGSKISEKMRKRQAKKSNDIIMDMNIMKLDLMKNEETDTIDRNVKNIMSSNDHIDLLAGVNRLKPKKLKEKADETIFKAISLKLDLMKDSQDGKGGNTPNKNPRFGRPLQYTNEDDIDNVPSTTTVGMKNQRKREDQTKEGQATNTRIRGSMDGRRARPHNHAPSVTDTPLNNAGLRSER
tara:strand:- start:3261 stop:4895 length:1635 start_codon:yes stop_codon:yes gene_type:complete